MLVWRVGAPHSLLPWTHLVPWTPACGTTIDIYNLQPNLTATVLELAGQYESARGALRSNRRYFSEPALLTAPIRTPSHPRFQNGLAERAWRIPRKHAARRLPSTPRPLPSPTHGPYEDSRSAAGMRRPVPPAPPFPTRPFTCQRVLSPIFPGAGEVRGPRPLS